MTKNPALKAGAGALAALAIGFGVSACGSSKAAGVATVPGGGATVEAVAPRTNTPTSGPLSKEPTYSKSSAAAPTKLVVKTLVQGNGTAAAAGDDVTVNYDGYIYATGQKFSGGSTWASSTAATPDGPTSIDGFVKGFSEGLVGVKTGSRVELIIPPSLAYGNSPPPDVPKNATLVFFIDMLKVSPASATSSAGAAGAAAAGG